MKSSTARRRLSVEDYILSEEKSDIRHEFINHQLIPMAGTSDIHNEICGNLYILFRSLFRGTLTKVYQENIKVQITDKTDYTYPDILVTCDERDVENKYIKKFPTLIVEVLSNSTRLYDKTDKFIRYRKIATLRHYLLVDADKLVVECWTKNDEGEWDSQTYTTLEQNIDLSVLNVHLPMLQIYQPQ